MAHTFTAPLWRWQSNNGPAAWFFVTVPPEISDDIEQQTDGLRGGFGSVKVSVTVGATTWSTSLFPSSQHEAYILPVKKQVRVAEELDEDDAVRVRLEIV